MSHRGDTKEILLITSARPYFASIVGAGFASVAERQGMPQSEINKMRNDIDQAMAKSARSIAMSARSNRSPADSFSC